LLPPQSARDHWKAGIETYVPRNLSSMAVALWNLSWIDANWFSVFPSKALYRWKGNVRGHPGGPHHIVAWPGAPAPPPGVAICRLFSVSPLESVYVTAK
jgi:hypothetical protein